MLCQAMLEPEAKREINNIDSVLRTVIEKVYLLSIMYKVF